MSATQLNEAKWIAFAALGAGILYLLFNAAKMEQANDSSIGNAIGAVLAIPGELLQGLNNDIRAFAEPSGGDGNYMDLGNPDTAPYIGDPTL